jgi:hypothetical protein
MGRREELEKKVEHLREASDQLRMAGYGAREQPRKDVQYEITKNQNKLEDIYEEVDEE